MYQKFEATIGGKTFTVETGKIAKQADGAVTVRVGGTVVLVTAVCSRNPVEGKDFFPLTVEYQERTYAAGRIPGGFFKREGKPSEKEILTSRLIDRPIRPLFPEGMINEVQIVAVVLSSDGENDPDICAMLGASMSLTISNIPFDGPMASARVGRVDGNFILNPTYQDLEKSDLDLVVAGKKGKILMIESGSKELDEKVIMDAFIFAESHFAQIIDWQEKMRSTCGNKKREDIGFLAVPEKLMADLSAENKPKLEKIILLPGKEQREEAFEALCDEMIEKYVTDESECNGIDIKVALSKIEESLVRDYTLNSGKRVDGRTAKEIRAIDCMVGVLPRTHGSGLFTRGQTQSLSVTTLGTSADEQMIDSLEGATQKSFMLHYNFPPFSVGEVKPLRGPGRREIGHGALAERALKAVMPDKDKFPYTVRVVSDILESNGSSSMASACAGALSLMDAGVPIKAPVAGVAVGMFSNDKKHIILTDIAGLEDHYGDMDFKIAGTKDGITAIQLDIKIAGLTMAIVEETMKQSKEARLKILGIMEKVISKPKPELSEFAPRIIMLKINTDKIKDLIGPGGKVIKKIIQDTGVSIDIEDDGTVQVASSDGEAMKKAIDIINGITAEPEIGKVYKGTITRLMNFGAFCEFMPGREGLIHVSELADKFVKNVSDVVKVGDDVMVKVIEIDDQGRINLSRKQAVGG